MRVLVIGGTGQVGTELRALAASQGFEIVAPDRAAVDLRDPRSIALVLDAGPWDVVINAAAYTDVDRAEAEQDAAFAINADAPSMLAAETAARGVPLIHISTDYVFDGKKGAPYVEDDPVAPLNVYGRSKLAGEIGVRAGNPRHLIVRTAWVYSPYGRNFVRTILRLAGERDELRIVADQRGCPTAAHDVALVCLQLARRAAAGMDHCFFGTYHYAGAGEATWFEFASTIVELAASSLAKPPRLVAIRTADFPTAAARAADTRLDCSRILRDHAIRSNAWRHGLERTIERLLTKREVA